MKKITIRLSKDGGKSVLETEGFSGGECERAAAPFRAKLGQASEEERTPEYYAGETCQQLAYE